MAEPFRTIVSRVIPLPAENVDTDQVIPARFLKRTGKAGLAGALFHDWRYLADGSPDPAFVLNRREMQGRAILLTGDNFGAGSSREHAPWALVAWGIRVILSTGFADIFRNNAGKMGLVVATVPDDAVHRLWEAIEEDPQLEIVVDVEHKRVAAPAIGLDVAFELDDFTQHRLLHGLDDIGLTLRHADAISTYEARRAAFLPRVG